MHRTAWTLCLGVLAGLALAASEASARQAPDTTTALVAPDTATPEPIASEEALRVYLDCQGGGCDFTYIRREIAFVSYVRDPEAAQVHLLVTNQGTGGGGRAYRLAFLTRGKFAGRDQRLSFVSPQSDSWDERRRGLTQVIKMGLLPYVAETPLAPGIRISFDGVPQQASATAASDPWNHWVFRIGAGGSLEQEASQGSIDFNGYLSADRVTEEWKIRSHVELDYDHRSFERGEQAITSTRHDLRGGLNLVKSLGPRWSVAVFNQAYSATFTNVAAAFRVTPAIEYNIFPWDISDRKVFTVAYTTGLRSFRYLEETIYGRMAETLPFQSLRSSLRLTQPWGSFRATVEGSHYFSDLDKHRVELDTDLSFRLTRGLSLELGVDAESIHDQLYLPKGDASLEEILLQRRRLATTYEFGTRVGLRYTFGSIFNNVVNPRF